MGATRLLQEPLYSTKGACAKFSNRMIGASRSERLASRQRLSFTSPSRTAQPTNTGSCGLRGRDAGSVPLARELASPALVELRKKTWG